LSGRFEVEKAIKTTNAVTTFLGVNKTNKTEVVIRVLHSWKFIVRPDLKRIVEDIRRVKDLKHPHIIQSIEGRVLERVPYVIIKDVKGDLLSDKLKKNEPALPHFEIAEITTNLADAINHAHRLGFVHKGISPSCVYLTDNGPVLSGFGFPDISFDKTGSMSWSDPVFQSPEALAGKSINRASDIYSFAMLVVCMLLAGCLKRIVDLILILVVYCPRQES